MNLPINRTIVTESLKIATTCQIHFSKMRVIDMVSKTLAVHMVKSPQYNGYRKITTHKEMAQTITS